MLRQPRELSIKDSFLNELRMVPNDMTHQVWEKINMLSQDPIPDGDLKKKLKNYRDIFRIRAGNYRIFYCFGGNWVRIISIRARKEKDIYTRDATWENPMTLPDNHPDEIDDDEILAGGQKSSPKWNGQIPARALPRKLDPEWLGKLAIPDIYFDVLGACVTEDNLLETNVPDDMLARVIDNLFPKDVAEIATSQPDRLLFDTQDLIRFKEGDLLSFLLRLDSDQERLVDWALAGPAMIRGGPGTGKSTVAIYRVKALIDHARSKAQKPPRILFSTYTPALVRFSKQLLNQLLNADVAHVHVDTADNIALSIAASAKGKIPDIHGRDLILAQFKDYMSNLPIETQTSLSRFRHEYLLDELDWIIDGRNLKSHDEYLLCDRTGRGISLHPGMRSIIWEVLNSFRHSLRAKGIDTIGSVRIDAFELLSTGKFKPNYDNVIIDEAQDLTPVALSILVNSSFSPTGIYITADSSQSIYFRGFTWQSVHDCLRFRGRTAVLRKNYRTTKSIAAAANAFLTHASSELLESKASLASMDGPLPVLANYGDDDTELSLISSFIRQMSRHLQLKPFSGALLVPNEEIGRQLAERLKKIGISSRYMRGTQLDLTLDEVKIMTFRAVKGLEFPFIVITGLRDDLFPKLPKNIDPEEVPDELNARRRTLFVAMTRAMRGLMLIHPENKPSRFIKDLQPEYWYVK